MSWFTRLNTVAGNKPEPSDSERYRGDLPLASSPIEWEVLSQSEEQTRKAAGSDADACPSSDDESLTVIEDEEEMKTQIEALKKQLSAAARDKASLEEKLARAASAATQIEEKSNRAVIRMRAELSDAQRSMSTMEAEITKVRAEAKAATEEAQQAQVRARLEMKGTKLVSEEKTQKLSRVESENQALREEIRVAKGEIERLRALSDGLSGERIRLQESSGVLQEQKGSLEKENSILNDEVHRLTTQNTQVLTILGIRAADDRSPYIRQDLSSEADATKKLAGLNSEIYDAAAYMSDSFTYELQPSKTNEIRDAYERVTKALGSPLVSALTSKRHDEDPLMVQIAFQYTMVECCRRIITSWCFDGSRVEEALPALYDRMRKTEAQAGTVSMNWRALTRTLVRSMLHGQAPDISSRVMPILTDNLVDVLLVAGCQGNRAHIHDLLSNKFSSRISNIITLAIRLNEITGEEITSCDLKVAAYSSGVDFDAKIMEDGYDDGKWHGLAWEQPRVLCTTELGLHKKVPTSSEKAWKKVLVVKPKIVLSSLPSSLRHRDLVIVQCWE
ncbi:hypothetical protein HWV62_24562 [Athelia sp. TMB]|nr:hypothetical protein HWV62_24562 [Athelia sp. TMB]